MLACSTMPPAKPRRPVSPLTRSVGFLDASIQISSPRLIKRFKTESM
ncbi:hypothetical protein LINGRAHAP2_LOCUS10639 [Linum grandiflorum]